MEIILLGLLAIGLPASVCCTNMLYYNMNHKKIMYHAGVLSLCTNLSLFVIYAINISWRLALTTIVISSILSYCLQRCKLTKNMIIADVTIVYATWLLSIFIMLMIVI